MRAIGAALRVPVTVETVAGNLGDGDTYAPAVTVLANVKGTRNVRRTTQGDTITDPYVLEVAHTANIPVGARVTIDGQTARVESSELVRGPYGVPHHREVKAL
jgi:hypothetical protein